MTITQKIIEIHEGKTARQIADALSIPINYVFKTASYHGLTLVRDNRRHGTKLTQDQADAIRRDFRSLDVISSEYGVSKAHISRIRGGKHFHPRLLAYEAEKSLHNPKELRGPIR